MNKWKNILKQLTNMTRTTKKISTTTKKNQTKSTINEISNKSKLLEQSLPSSMIDQHPAIHEFAHRNEPTSTISTENENSTQMKKRIRKQTAMDSFIEMKETPTKKKKKIVTEEELTPKKKGPPVKVKLEYELDGTPVKHERKVSTLKIKLINFVIFSELIG
jgi:hypothetical protein